VLDGHGLPCMALPRPRLRDLCPICSPSRLPSLAVMANTTVFRFWSASEGYPGDGALNGSSIGTWLGICPSDSLQQLGEPLQPPSWPSSCNRVTARFASLDLKQPYGAELSKTQGG